MRPKLSDRGWTRLGRIKVRKDHRALAVLGDCDGLNSLLGACLALLEKNFLQGSAPHCGRRKPLCWL